MTSPRDVRRFRAAFRGKQIRDISARSGCLDHGETAAVSETQVVVRVVKEARNGEPGGHLAQDSARIGTYVISFRPRFRKSLIFRGAFLHIGRLTRQSELGSLRGNSFAALGRDSSRKFTALVVRAVT